MVMPTARWACSVAIMHYMFAEASAQTQRCDHRISTTRRVSRNGGGIEQVYNAAYHVQLTYVYDLVGGRRVRIDATGRGRDTSSTVVWDYWLTQWNHQTYLEYETRFSDCVAIGLYCPGGCTLNPSAPPTTQAPTRAPTQRPTGAPSRRPTRPPTESPTDLPTTSEPSARPSVMPTVVPSTRPTWTPTASPSSRPSVAPSAYPTWSPTGTPTPAPTGSPTDFPTSSPTGSPTAVPTAVPSATPSVAPSRNPTTSPTAFPTSEPTKVPTDQPVVMTSAPTPSNTVDVSQNAAKGSSQQKMSMIIIIAVVVVALALIIVGIAWKKRIAHVPVISPRPKPAVNNVLYEKDIKSVPAHSNTRSDLAPPIFFGATTRSSTTDTTDGHHAREGYYSAPAPMIINGQSSTAAECKYDCEETVLKLQGSGGGGDLGTKDGTLHYEIFKSERSFGRLPAVGASKDTAKATSLAHIGSTLPIVDNCYDTVQQHDVEKPALPAEEKSKVVAPILPLEDYKLPDVSAVTVEDGYELPLSARKSQDISNAAA